MNSSVHYLLLAAVVVFAVCGKSNPSPSATEATAQQLKAATWTLAEAKDPSGNVVTASYKDMTLKVDGTADRGTYTTTNGAPVWPCIGDVEIQR